MPRAVDIKGSLYGAVAFPLDAILHGPMGARQQAHVTGMNIRRSASPAERLSGQGKNPSRGR
jgi:hypothetical protein